MDVTFCPNSFDKFHSLKTLDEFKTSKAGESFEARVHLVSGLVSEAGKPPSKHRVGGEEPCDEMRRKGLGEEPRLAFEKGRR